MRSYYEENELETLRPDIRKDYPNGEQSYDF
jgi:hypothetical protein